MTTDTTTVGRAQAPAGIEPHRAPVEAALGAALRAMRDDAERAAETGGDEYVEEWRARALDAPALIVAGAVEDGDIRLWLMAPGAANDLVFSAQVHELGAERDIGGAEAAVKTKPLATICDDVGWLVKEATGSFPGEP